MLWLSIVFLAASALAGSDEDTVDRALGEFTARVSGKKFSAPQYSIEFTRKFGQLDIKFAVNFFQGSLRFVSATRDGPVSKDKDGRLNFRSAVNATMNYTYKFGATTSTTLSYGESVIDWTSVLDGKLSVEDCRGNLEPFTTKPKTFNVNVFPIGDTRSATVYPATYDAFVRTVRAKVDAYIKDNFKDVVVC